MKKPFLVVNPRSANGATARHFDGIARAVRGAVGDVEHAFTERAMHAADLTREALRAGHDVVIAVGGDGTVNEFMNVNFCFGQKVWVLSRTNLKAAPIMSQFGIIQ